MTQTNVNAGGSGGVVERDGSAAGMSMGLITAIVLGVALLAVIAWYTLTQTTFFGTAYAPAGSTGSTNVNVTNNQPPAGQTGSTTGSTSGSTGSTTGGSTTGSTAGR